MSKHTPGPWEWQKDNWYGGYSSLIGPNDEDVLRPEHCNDGDTGAAWFGDELSEANAHLISASPELLAACKAFSLAMRKGEKVQLLDLIDALKLSDAAITKAEAPDA